jgi:hypothetical protein
MSMTAGMGAGDYVEISRLAVAAGTLALLSLLGLLSRYFLLLGLVAVVLAIVALRQIRRSNGTQGGKGVAWLALSVSAVVSGGALLLDLAAAATDARDGRAIVAQVERLSSALAAREYDAAWEMFSAEFRQRVSRQRFGDYWRQVETSADQIGRLEGLVCSGRFEFVKRTSGGRVGATALSFKFAKLPEPTGMATLTAAQREDGTWGLNDLPDIFPPEKPRP